MPLVRKIDKAPQSQTGPKSFAVVETGGKQYLVKKGDTILVERLPRPIKGNALSFEKVLLLENGSKTSIGTPYISGAKIPGEYVEEGKGKKIIVLKYKAKSRRRTKRGHRQIYTKVKITSLS